MADYYLLSWDAAEFNIVSGADPFSDYNDPNYSALGTVFTVGTGEVITVSDNDTIFDETDFNQEFEGSSDPDGRNPSAGTDIDPEYMYVIRPDGGPTDGSQDIRIYVYEMGVGPGADGFVADAYVSPNIEYEIVAIDNQSHDIAYSNVFLCFAGDTRIETPSGPRRADTLGAGDIVWTVDDGFQPLLWTGSREFCPNELRLNEKARPVLIRAGALAPGMPRNDTVLSPQHRVLLRSPIVERMFDVPEILVPAHTLVGVPGVTRYIPPQGVRYVHLLLGRHHILSADGLLTESLMLGPEAFRAMNADQRREVDALLAQNAGETGGITMEPARKILRGRRLRKLLKRHRQNDKPLVMPVTTEKPAQTVTPLRLVS